MPVRFSHLMPCIACTDFEDRQHHGPEGREDHSRNLDFRHHRCVSRCSLVISSLLMRGYLLYRYAWINRQMKAARPEFIYSRRKARQAKAMAPAGTHFVSSTDA
jgi:hypothetical protein